MKKILILVPSRDQGTGRISNVERLVKSWKDTTSGSSDLMVIIDEDEADKYPILEKQGVIVFTLPRMNLVPKLNTVAKIYTHFTATNTKLKVLSFMGDDCVFQTPGWEERVIEWQEANKGICYCNDLLQGEVLPNNVFIWADIVRSLGFMCPPVLQHYYIDNFWLDLGIRLKRMEYFSDIIIEHKHWSNNKAYKDDLYIESEKLMSADRLAWDTYRHLDLDIDTERVKKALYDGT